MFTSFTNAFGLWNFDLRVLSESWKPELVRGFSLNVVYEAEVGAVARLKIPFAGRYDEAITRNEAIYPSSS